MHQRLFCLAGLALAGSATAQIQLTELVTLNLDSTAVPANPEYIGSNPGAIAWTGSELYLAGFNNSNAAGTVAICRISGVLATPSFGAAFGSLATPAFRGYSGLDVSVANNRVAAAYDDGAADPNGLTAFDLSGASLWTVNMRGGSGVGFDPRHPVGSQAAGVAWTQFGSGRRALQDLAGAAVYTTSNGMVILTSQGSFWRDMTFDPATGDIWLREGNNVIRGTRNGDNAIASLAVLFDPTDADSVNQQNLAFCRTPSGAFVIYNDRGTATPNQDFFAVIRAMRPDGTAEALDFGAFTPFGNGGGNYDFSYDAATNTLAILDIYNRRAHVFAVNAKPYYRYGSGCQGSNALTPSLDLTGTGAPNTTLGFDLSNGVPNSAGFVLLGLVPGNTPLAGSCAILVDPILPVFLGAVLLDAQGAGSTSLTIPAGSSGTQLTFQGVLIDAPLNVFGLSVTNGVTYIVP